MLIWTHIFPMTSATSAPTCLMRPWSADWDESLSQGILHWGALCLVIATSTFVFLGCAQVQMFCFLRNVSSLNWPTVRCRGSILLFELFVATICYVPYNHFQVARKWTVPFRNGMNGAIAARTGGSTFFLPLNWPSQLCQDTPGSNRVRVRSILAEAGNLPHQRMDDGESNRNWRPSFGSKVIPKKTLRSFLLFSRGTKWWQGLWHKISGSTVGSRGVGPFKGCRALKIWLGKLRWQSNFEWKRGCAIFLQLHIDHPNSYVIQSPKPLFWKLGEAAAMVTRKFSLARIGRQIHPSRTVCSGATGGFGFVLDFLLATRKTSKKSL